MGSGVPKGTRVATPYMAAGQALPQVQPPDSYSSLFHLLHTVLAAPPAAEAAHCARFAGTKVTSGSWARPPLRHSGLLWDWLKLGQSVEVLVVHGLEPPYTSWRVGPVVNYTTWGAVLVWVYL